MDLQKEREAFEAWHYEQYLLENPNIDISNAKYIYDYAHKNALVFQLKESHFLAWQAAKAHEAEKLKGKVVVPVEPTQAMIDAVRSEHEGEPYLPYSLYKSFLKAATVEAARGGNE